MPNLLVKQTGDTGRVIHVTPETAGWTYVGFDLYRLKPGETARNLSESRETCLVFVTGKGEVTTGTTRFGELGKRTSPFEGKPYAVYIPAGADWAVTATTDLELAVCTAPGTPHSRPAQAYTPDDLEIEHRGKGTNVRHVTNILSDADDRADSLLVVEVITPAANTSSYPPHKHDKDDFPNETLLEETYYHRLNPPQGFAFQRVYTDDRSLDEAMAVEDGNVTLVPEGYHPVATCHGYDSYYLNVMAGPRRAWRFHNAKEHEWLLKARESDD